MNEHNTPQTIQTYGEYVKKSDLLNPIAVTISLATL